MASFEVLGLWVMDRGQSGIESRMIEVRGKGFSLFQSFLLLVSFLITERHKHLATIISENAMS